MRITLAMVSSVDGKTTHPTLHGWSSPEDQDHFRKLKTMYPIIIMGRKTYDTVKGELQLSLKTRRIVMTQNPDAHENAQVPGQLEFTNESPRMLVRHLTAEGVESALLVGGSDINQAFLKDKLITDCYITIEPRFFGNGKSIFTSDAIDIPLQLTDVTTLNTRGTLLLHYIIRYEHNAR